MTETTMRALVWRGGDELVMETLAEPRPGAGQALIEIEIAGICGSDLHAYRGHPGPRRPPLVLGHEAVGRLPGDEQRYVVFPLAYCGECPACHRGAENLCAHRGLLGLDRQGVFAERVAVDAGSLMAMPAGLNPRLGALVEPLATPYAALEENLGPGEGPVLVLGCGPIGLLAVYVCKTRGVEVVAVDPVSTRRGLASRLGADAVSDSAADLDPGSFALVLDAVGVEATWTSAVAAVRAGGRVIVVGLGQAAGGMPVGDLVRRGIGVIGHYAYTRRQFEAALALLAEHPLPLDWVDVVPLESGAEAFARVADPAGADVKIMLTPDIGMVA